MIATAVGAGAGVAGSVTRSPTTAIRPAARCASNSSRESPHGQEAIRHVSTASPASATTPSLARHTDKNGHAGPSRPGDLVAPPHRCPPHARRLAAPPLSRRRLTHRGHAARGDRAFSPPGKQIGEPKSRQTRIRTQRLPEPISIEAGIKSGTGSLPRNPAR